MRPPGEDIDMMHGDGTMGFWMHGMGGFGFLHWVAFIPFLAAVVYRIGMILKRLGHSPLWVVLAFIPVANIIGRCCQTNGNSIRIRPNPALIRPRRSDAKRRARRRVDP
jgi:hypothetical protein